MYRGQKGLLRTKISTEEGRKFKHTSYLFSGMRCAAALPGMAAVMSITAW